MRVFACPTCRHLVTFESERCLHCGSELAYDPRPRELVALEQAADRCADTRIAACNWRAQSPGERCASCALTRTRPNDADAVGLAALAAAEAAKRRLLFELAELGLPVIGWREREGGLGFDLLSSEHEPVTTGHADGIITLDLAEADPGSRERRRTELGEPYRTLLGHLRHEVGHYYQEILAPEGSPERDACREIFGDDRADYQAALDRHYESGPPADWHEHFVSAYASTHPWEDWAETFAHYLHIRDGLQTATAHGLSVAGPDIPTADVAPLETVPTDRGDMRALLDSWLPLIYALNAMNRSLGAGDLYPFVLTPAVEAKLTFLHGLVGDRPTLRAGLLARGQ
ncbi:MAG: hypothetical protein QOG68_1046 [Solirubrobacteraceae bacterium]|nr:hypothetical protein [Solirubrobacteraceae bacterium]